MLYNCALAEFHILLVTFKYQKDYLVSLMLRNTNTVPATHPLRASDAAHVFRRSPVHAGHDTRHLRPGAAMQCVGPAANEEDDSVLSWLRWAGCCAYVAWSVVASRLNRKLTEQIDDCRGKSTSLPTDDLVPTPLGPCPMTASREGE
jgi:hypothetical protein